MRRTVELGCVQETALIPLYGRAMESRKRRPILEDPKAVEIGAGLNTRFERLDNGTVHRYDLDLPDMLELRRFFCDSDRRKTLAASVLDGGWIGTVRESPGPYFLVAETVFVYLEEVQVRAALAQIARGLPQVEIALDTVGRRAVDSGNRDFALAQYGGAILVDVRGPDRN